MFRTRLNTKEYKGRLEKVDSEKIVETAGFIKAETRINNIMLAGQRLADFRRGQFDFEPGQEVDEDYYDPINKSLDIVEVMELKSELEERLKETDKKIEEIKENASTSESVEDSSKSSENSIEDKQQ